MKEQREIGRWVSGAVRENSYELEFMKSFSLLGIALALQTGTLPLYLSFASADPPSGSEQDISHTYILIQLVTAISLHDTITGMWLF